MSNLRAPGRFGKRQVAVQSASYSPLFTRFSTANPAFLASLIETGLVMLGVLNPEMSFRMGFLQAGQAVSSFAVNGRRKVKRPPHAAQLPSHNSYS